MCHETATLAIEPEKSHIQQSRERSFNVGFVRHNSRRMGGCARLTEGFNAASSSSRIPKTSALGGHSERSTGSMASGGHDCPHNGVPPEVVAKPLRLYPPACPWGNSVMQVSLWCVAKASLALLLRSGGLRPALLRHMSRGNLSKFAGCLRGSVCCSTWCAL